MKTYLDTSVLVSLHLRDSSYATAAQIMRTANGAIWTPWQKVEFGNAMRARIHRGDITRADFKAIETNIRRTLQAGDLHWHPLPAYALWHEAEKLSIAHTPALGVRTLDLLHVAAACVLRATHFYTLDTRQHALARAAGLQIN